MKMLVQDLSAGNTGAFAARATDLLARNPQQAQSALTQAFAASLASATATSAQQAAATTAQAAAEAFSLSGGSVSVAVAFALVSGWVKLPRWQASRAPAVRPPSPAIDAAAWPAVHRHHRRGRQCRRGGLCARHCHCHRGLQLQVRFLPRP